MTGTYANGINTDRPKRLELLCASWRFQSAGRTARPTKDSASLIKTPAKVIHFYSLNLEVVFLC